MTGYDVYETECEDIKGCFWLTDECQKLVNKVIKSDRFEVLTAQSV
jgi:hypothetical protein